MKKFTIKIMSAGLAIMLLNVVAGAQTPVAVTGTATASNGLPFASGTYTIQLVDSSGNSLSQFSIGGGTNTQTRFSGTLTTAGALAVSLYANTVIYPNSTKWNFTICSQVPVSLVPNPAATATCYSQAISITAAGSISTPLSASAPAYYPCQIWNGSSVVGCGGGGIDQLTGDGTAGPGTGSQVFTAAKLPGHITLTGTPVANDGIVATSSTTAVWATTPGIAPVPCPGGTQANGQCYAYPNDATGTGLNLLACFVGVNAFHSQTIQTCPITANGTDVDPAIIGVVVANAGTTGNATVQVGGTVPWICDSLVVADGTGYWVEPSTTVAGECEQATGSFAPSPNENPELHTILGRPVLANTGAGTAALIEWLPNGSYATNPPVGINGGSDTNLSLMGDGSGYLSASHMYQTPSTDPCPYCLASNGIAFHSGGTSHYVEAGNIGNGVSGNDISFWARYGDNAPADEAWQWLSPEYLNPSTCGSFSSPGPCTGSGTLALGNRSGFFDPGTSTGLYVVHLTGNGTTYTPLTDINPGQVLRFEITPGAFCWTWPTGSPAFIGAPVVCNSTTPLISEFSFDGTNLNCMVGCGTVNSGTAGQLGYYAATGTAISGLTLGTNLSITGGTLNATSGGSGTVATANQYQLYYSSGSPSGNTATGSTFLLTDAGGDLLSTSTSAEPLILGNGIGTQIQYVGVDAGRASFGTNIPGTGFLNADISGSVNRGIEFSVNNSTLGGNIVGMFDINGDFCLDGTVVSNLCPSNATFEVTAAGAATAASFGTTSNTNAGYAWLAGNNTNPTILANTAGWLGPASSSFTGYACQMPATAPSNSTPYLSCGTPSGGVSTGTWVSGTTSPTSSYYQSPLIGNTAVAFGGSSTQIWGHAFIPQSNVTFGAIYTTSNTADASNFYSVAISDSSGNLICSVTTGSAVPTAATTLVSTCSQSTPTLVAGNVYILLTTGSATTGKLEATVANGANGPFYSTNVTGCTALLGVITGTCSITLTAPVPYTQGIPTFTLH